MKKTYMTPEIEVVKIQTACILAASDPETLKATVSDDEVSTGWADGRGGDVDDDF